MKEKKCPRKRLREEQDKIVSKSETLEDANPEKKPTK